MKHVTIVLAALLVVYPGIGTRLAFAEAPGHALRFDGVSDLVRLGVTSSMIGAGWTATKTVSVWVKPTGTATCTGADPGSCDAILGDRPRTWGISRGTLDGSDRIWIWNYDGTFDRVGIEYAPGEWMQVALVHDGGVLSAYKNGALAGSVPSGATPQGGGQGTLHLGGIISNASKNWTFEGEMDEVRIWSVARSGGEILEDMNVGLTGTETGLAAYYKMSDGAGASVTDDSGHGWTGTIIDGGPGVPADGPAVWAPSGAFGAEPPPLNTPPSADSQSLAIPEDTALPVTLTGSDADEDDITFQIVTQPSLGTLSGTAPDLVYTPLPNLHGMDSFSFVATDGHVNSPAATVTISIVPTNDPPVSQDDSAVTGVDTPVVLDVLGNDSDVDGDGLTIVDVGTPSLGAAITDGTTITYTPAVGLTGIDTFSYTVTDGNGAFATAQATVTTRVGPDPTYAIRFDGVSDFASLAQTAHMLAPGWESTKSVSLWVRPTGSSFCNVPSPASCDAIFGDRPRWWGISRGVVNGLDRIWVWNFDGALKAIPIEYQPDQWVHVALVHGGGTMSAYRNGVLVGSVSSGPTLQPNTGGLPVLQIGGIINNAARNWTFAGDIDEVQVWNVARTGGEINQDMAGPIEGAPAGLAAYYRMSEGAGTWINDESGNNWTGELRDGGQGVPADGPILWVPSGAFTPPE